MFGFGNKKDPDSFDLMLEALKGKSREAFEKTIDTHLKSSFEAQQLLIVLQTSAKTRLQSIDDYRSILEKSTPELSELDKKIEQQKRRKQGDVEDHRSKVNEMLGRSELPDEIRTKAAKIFEKNASPAPQPSLVTQQQEKTDALISTLETEVTEIYSRMEFINTLSIERFNTNFLEQRP